MGKKRKRNRREPQKAVPPWWRRAWAKLGLIPLSTILAIWGAAWAYKSSGADELRAKIYEPLYTDIRNLEDAVKAVSIDKPPNTQKLAELTQTGAFERVPRSVRNRVLRVSEDTQKIHSAVMTVNEAMVREMSSRIVHMRSQETDRQWREQASEKLREMSRSGRGISDSVLFTLNHSGRSRSVDVRGPAKPVIAGPGGPAFVLNDWLAYPASISTIEKLWTDVDYLYFNEVRDAWYYQLTRDDLQRTNTTLTDFLKPVYELFKQDPNFKLLQTKRQPLLSEITDLKATLADRIRDPKQLGDLISR